MKYLILVILVPLTKLMIDDFRRREVTLAWLIALAVITFGMSLISNGLREMLARSGQNLLLIGYLGIGLVIWTWIRSRKLINPVNVYIGLGDVLFFLSLMPLFQLERFALLLVTCMIFSLIWWQVVRFVKKYSADIPLVATSGIVTSGVIIFSVFFE